jgi:drug/metabolite transporter (DMT)-like permease
MLIIADDIGPLVAVVFLSPIILGVAARGAMIALKRKRGQRPWWGLAIGLLSVLCGLAVIFMLATTRGGAPSFFYLAGAFPLLAGIGCLVIWNQRPRV